MQPHTKRVKGDDGRLPEIHTRGTFMRPPSAVVSHVFHATHIENAVKMVSRADTDPYGTSVTVELNARAPERPVNDVPVARLGRLLYFSCPLGPYEEGEVCRYGPVQFRLYLGYLLEQFRQVIRAGSLSFYVLGTSVYKQEYSHKVLVTSGDQDFPDLNRLMDSPQEPTDDFPLFCCNKEWMIRPRYLAPEGVAGLSTESKFFEQMEFVLSFPRGNDHPLELDAEISFVNHRTICVPRMRPTFNDKYLPKLCPAEIIDRPDSSEAQKQFVAMVLNNHLTNADDLCGKLRGCKFFHKARALFVAEIANIAKLTDENRDKEFAQRKVRKCQVLECYKHIPKSNVEVDKLDSWIVNLMEHKPTA